MKRIMILPTGAPPRGWECRRNVDGFMDLIGSENAAEIEDIAISGTIRECEHMAEAVIRLAHRQFHLFSGMIRITRLHFHDADHDTATACMRHVSSAVVDQLLPDVDTHVPIGECGVWRREDATLVLPGMKVPETVLEAVKGGPVSNLIASPMLPEDLIITGYRDHPRDLIITTERSTTA